MTRIFNLSYDISEEMAKQNHVKPEDMLTRESFMKILIDESVIITDTKFIISRKGNPVSEHIVLNPVKTTIIFKSVKARADVVKVLARYIKQMHYVITEVKEDEDLYLGSLHNNDDLQATCDAIVNNIINNK